MIIYKTKYTEFELQYSQQAKKVLQSVTSKKMELTSKIF